MGKLADLVVLSDDYFSLPDEEIRSLSSVLTLVGGPIVHAGEEIGQGPIFADDFESGTTGAWSTTFP